MFRSSRCKNVHFISCLSKIANTQKRVHTCWYCTQIIHSSCSVSYCRRKCMHIVRDITYFLYILTVCIFSSYVAPSVIIRNVPLKGERFWIIPPHIVLTVDRLYATCSNCSQLSFNTASNTDASLPYGYHIRTL